MTFGKLQVDQIESSTRVLNVDDLLSGTEDVVTSVGLSAPTGFTVSESPVTGSGVISLTYSQGYSLPSNTSQSNWDTAYLERRYWDGGSSGLNASTARISLGLGNSSTLNVGTIAGTVAAGDDTRFTTNLSYTPSTRLLSSSTGSDVTIPEATTTVPGLQSAADKIKLDSIATGAQVNVPTNLTYTQSTRLLGSSTGDDVTLPDATTSFSGLMSATDKGKLDGIASGAEVNVNADWDSVSGDSLILNKPSIPLGADSLPQPLGVAAVGSSLKYSRENHVHAIPSAVDVGADPSGTAASAVSAHVAAADPHPGYALESALGTAAALNHGTAAGDLVRLDPTTGKLPAVDGSLLTNLPAGGNSNQHYAAGYWISPIEGTIANGASMVADQICMHPFVLKRSITVGEIGARVVFGAAGASLQLAIYASLNGAPSGAPLASTTSLSASSATTISDNVTDFNIVGGAIYWMAASSDGTPVLQAFSSTNLSTAAIIGAPTLSVLSAASTTMGGWRLINHPFGSWPTLAPNDTTVQGFANPRGGIVFLQVAALL